MAKTKEKQKKGGKRPGAGRKKGSKLAKTLEKEQALDFMRKEILKKFTPLLDAKLDLALGHYEMKKDEEGEVRVYKKAPNGSAIEYLFAMVVGKPKEEVENKIDGLDKLTDAIGQLLKPKK